MKAFAALYRALDSSTATSHKVRVMAQFFAATPATDDGAHDAAWAAYLLAGGKPRQAVPTAVLREAAQQAAGIPPWLFEDCYATVGDLAETIAYLTPDHPRPTDATGAPDNQHRGEPGLAHWLHHRIAPLRGQPPEAQRDAVLAHWRELDADERFLYVKLIGGGFRVGVSRLLVQRALAEASGLPASTLAQRMMGFTDGKRPPTAERWRALVSTTAGSTQEGAQPYPFFLAHALQAPPDTLGDIGQWQAEWKLDGIRAQLVRRGGQTALWSRGEELISERFPELVAAASVLPDGTVIDGEVLVWPEGQATPAPFAQLQTRITRKTVTAKLLREQPACLMAYDLLEWHGQDLRQQPLSQRRAQLETEVGALMTSPTPTATGHDAPLPDPRNGRLRLSPRVEADSWQALAVLRDSSRERGVEGLMLKELRSAYGSGRTKSDGVWWKWKIDPLSVDAVLIYAQAGHGRRANVYTDYTFAVWNRSPSGPQEVDSVLEAIRARRPPEPGALQLVAFAKAYSGLSDEEFRAVDTLIRKTTVERFGPVRSVVPSLVFELGFEGLALSPRHKSGVATRFPRMLRIRHDKPLHEAETLQGLKALAGL
ncbi:MAG: ATP-dependent DNA ligase [Rubrivivax sp.]|jgi:DNA ligase-1|nr:ATP-dependent DNA ligase [Rubrivivax sp.]